ncbi:hypothetical protein ES332_A12G161500v1 [Gossypium tomentosum]|uniref:Uncharacterized protein n=1 Tax=Gossypium tomentosum TaxID=34277 RepID=A0A5D2MYT5_GOSTO|nr:hypothetical protein ES332_A12G161500v1 [Gossypium tomentosum]
MGRSPVRSPDCRRPSCTVAEKGRAGGGCGGDRGWYGGGRG